MQAAHQPIAIEREPEVDKHFHAVPGAERRDASRTVTVFHVARASTEVDTGLCRIQNIADGGLMLTTRLALKEGDSLVVALSESISLSGKVIWAEGDRAGLHFDTPIDCAATLEFLASERKSGAQRPPRLPVDTLGIASSELGVRAVRVLNISQQGMKIVHDGSFRAGLAVTILLANGLQRRGVVRWSEGEVAGVRLLEPIAYQELESASRL